jgi:hypothetical protein
MQITRIEKCPFSIRVYLRASAVHFLFGGFARVGVGGWIVRRGVPYACPENKESFRRGREAFFIALWPFWSQASER